MTAAATIWGMNAERVVAPFRESVRGLLSRVDLAEVDRVLLGAIGGKVDRLVAGYEAVDDPAVVIALAQEMDRLHSEVATITAGYRRS